ncbi:hypothetical protein JK364_46495 [Streptomyces sp. 110]|uniref:Uncharacterized protein n=1 Tax=Streptomyces endocoffeicus TaxID=2898945 RepID=A0ABS1Q4X9_9ACTN|nr:hypothetical protein [Streptomyces endocoffeicus]MBL1119717.1 hypothetical protein [Streptomyces endocoffeicus]
MPLLEVKQTLEAFHSLDGFLEFPSLFETVDYRQNPLQGTGSTMVSEFPNFIVTSDEFPQGSQVVARWSLFPT